MADRVVPGPVDSSACVREAAAPVREADFPCFSILFAPSMYK